MAGPAHAPGNAPLEHCGMVSLVGRANVGKSTLLNRMLDEKVSIVTPVAQTTRNVIRGILTEPRGQLVFLDTPGIHKAESDLGKMMNRMARSSVEGVDLVMLLFDASSPPRLEDEGWMRRLLFVETGVVAVLNKTDRAEDHREAYRKAWQAVEEEKDRRKPVTWVEVSAVTGDGVPELLGLLFERMPEGPLLFPEDVLTDFPRKLALADLIREKCFKVLHDEIPHHVAVRVEDIEETDAGWNVNAQIYVNRPSQKGIVIGRKGRLLKQVRQEAEKDIAEIYRKPVSLKLWVKVEKNWSKNYFLLKQLGYRE